MVCVVLCCGFSITFVRAICKSGFKACVKRESPNSVNLTRLSMVNDDYLFLVFFYFSAPRHSVRSSMGFVANLRSQEIGHGFVDFFRRD